MGTIALSEDTDEMPHYAAFHQGLHCLRRQNRSSENVIQVQYFWNLLPVTPKYILWTIRTIPTYCM